MQNKKNASIILVGMGGLSIILGILLQPDPVIAMLSLGHTMAYVILMERIDMIVMIAGIGKKVTVEGKIMQNGMGQRVETVESNLRFHSFFVLLWSAVCSRLWVFYQPNGQKNIFYLGYR